MIFDSAMASKMKNAYHKKTSLFYPEYGFHPKKLHGLSEEPNSFSQILRCFVAKVMYVAISCFWEHFWPILELNVTFFCTIWVFWAFYSVLMRIRFVVKYSLFRVKLFWLKPFFFFFFCVLSRGPQLRGGPSLLMYGR